ncbi:hypothetical protein Taro_020038 [Colocasia esculenta]|uniref:Uncharacterized protein n=1 Tax=Colocasia esculenta TaxID=4460 RepID=A0A843UV75_COLES|nr:hypothetical protein [Colocasia esculenta]
MFLWRVLKDKRLKIRSFLADLSNVHQDERQRIFNVQISRRRSLNTGLKTKKHNTFEEYYSERKHRQSFKSSGEGRPGDFQGGCIPFRVKEDLVVSRMVVFPSGLKEDQLRLGVRIREGDSTLDSEIPRYYLGTGRRSPVERSSEPG